MKPAFNLPKSQFIYGIATGFVFMGVGTILWNTRLQNSTPNLTAFGSNPIENTDVAKLEPGPVKQKQGLKTNKELNPIVRAAVVKTEGTTNAQTAKLDPDRQLQAALGRGETATSLAEIFGHYKHEDGTWLTQQERQAHVDKIIADPPRAMEIVREGLSRLSASEFPVERAQLFIIGSAVPSNAAEMRKLELAELTAAGGSVTSQNLIESSSESKESLYAGSRTEVIISAHLAFLQNTPNPDEALAGTIQAITAQSSPTLKRQIFDQFTRQYPQQTASLTRSLGAITPH
jgi:hypothetical protein